MQTEHAQQTPNRRHNSDARDSLSGLSVTSLRRSPPLPSKPEYKAPLRERCADGLLIRGSSDKSTHIHATRVPSPISDALCHTQSISLTTRRHTGTLCVERRRRWQRHARADGFGRGGAATAWAAAALSARACRLPAQLERGQTQGSVAARGSAAAVASRRAARARRGRQVIGRRVMAG